MQQEQLQKFIEKGLEELSSITVTAREMSVLHVYVFQVQGNSVILAHHRKYQLRQKSTDQGELVDGSDDPIEETTRDISWVVKPDLSKMLSKPFACVSACRYHGITSANIDLCIRHSMDICPVRNLQTENAVGR